ncbi:MAG: Nif3-like dinuclear metal center hexameric protein, partial [Candidatus Hydrogenedentota bacterium]
YRYCSFSAPGTGTFLPDESSSPVVGLKGKVNEEPELRFEVLVPKARSGAIISALVDAHPYEEVAYDLVRLEGNDSTISLGLRGTLDKPMPLGEFAKLTRKQLEVQHVRVVGDLADPVQRVAVMGGAGGGSIEHVPNDVDVFVTGDVKYHEAQLALERGLAVIDAGHHGTEKWIVPALANYLRAECEGLQVTEFVERDPFCVV